MLKAARQIIEKILSELKITAAVNYTVEIPPSAIDADVSTNVAILLSKIIKKNPKEIAGEIVEKIKKEKIVADAKFQSGFINIIFSDNYIYSSLIKSLLPLHTGILNGRKILVEFVSANPTGPLHIGHGRGAAYGDSLSRLFEFFGAEVEREYYINDVGNQMEILTQSVRSHIDKKPLQDIGYKGKYIEDIADEIKNSKLEIENVAIKEFTINKILEWIKNDLEKFGVHFNSWFRESSLYKKSEVDPVRSGTSCCDTSNGVDGIIQKLKEKNLAYEKDGAVWFKSTNFSDDKDRVLVREDGRKTYLASDIAYHFGKYKRNFDEYIDIWGADHHGYVERMKGAVKAFGGDDKKLKIILYQLVNIIKKGKKVNMSTRSGEFITLQEVMDEVGVDVARFFLLMRNSESHLDFDLDLAKEQTPENPVFYVQYGHARICSIFKEAGKKCSRLEDRELENGEKKLQLLKLKEERELIKKVLYFDDLLTIAARDYAPHYLTKYLQDIASCFHSYYNRNRIITENTDLTDARLVMCLAVKNVIKDGLNILGVSAPEKM